MRQLSIWSSATESRTSLRSSSFCFRDWTSWSLVRRVRPAKALNASQGSAEFADSTDFSHIQSLVPINALLVSCDCYREADFPLPIWPTSSKPVSGQQADAFI